jgi:hypothetical protein
LKIVVFYANLHPATEWSVNEYAPGAIFEDTSEDKYAYWRAIKKYWTGEEDLVVIEQDIEINADVIPSFIKCYEPWCVYSYEMGAPHCWLNESFGCTKFSAKLQRAVPTSEIHDGDHVWAGLDIVLSQTLKKHADIFAKYAKRAGARCTSHEHGHLMHHHRYKANPICIRDGIIPQGTLHQASLCKWCGPHDNPNNPAPGVQRFKDDNPVWI